MKSELESGRATSDGTGADFGALNVLDVLLGWPPERVEEPRPAEPRPRYLSKCEKDIWKSYLLSRERQHCQSLSCLDCLLVALAEALPLESLLLEP